jgi:hypothetical protein
MSATPSPYVSMKVSLPRYSFTRKSGRRSWSCHRYRQG